MIKRGSEPRPILSLPAAWGVLLAGLLTWGCTPQATSTEGPNGGTGGSSSASGGSSGSGSGGSNGGSATGGAQSSEGGGTGGGTGTGGSGNPSTGTGGAGSANTGGAGPGTGGSGSANTGGTAGREDAAADAPGTPSAGGGCMGVTAKFCDDWEKQEAGKAPTGDFTIAGSGVTVDTAKAFSGTKALHYKTSGAKVMLTFTKQLPIADLHGRLMLLMPKKPTTNSHWDIIQSKSGNYHWELGGMYGKFELVVDPPDDGIDSPTVFPEGDQWHCIQWNFKSGTNVFSAKLDNEFVKPSPVMNRWKTSGPFTNVTIGWEIFGSGAAEFYIDDLAFGEQEIPCPTK